MVSFTNLVRRRKSGTRRELVSRRARDKDKRSPRTSSKDDGDIRG